RLALNPGRRHATEPQHASGRLDPGEADHAQEDLLRQLATDLPLALRSADRHEPGRMHGLPVTAALALVALVPALTFLTYRQVGAPAFLEARPAANVARTALPPGHPPTRDRKSTRLNSSHVKISYAVF